MITIIIGIIVLAFILPTLLDVFGSVLWVLLKVAFLALILPLAVLALFCYGFIFIAIGVAIIWVGLSLMCIGIF